VLRYPPVAMVSRHIQRYAVLSINSGFSHP